MNPQFYTGMGICAICNELKNLIHCNSEIGAYCEDCHNELSMLEDFRRGLSMLGLARKYGLTVKQVEQIIRGYVR